MSNLEHKSAWFLLPNLSCYKILKAENEEQLITALNDLSRALKINKEDPEDIRTDIDFKKVIDNPNANKMFEQILSDYC